MPAQGVLGIAQVAFSIPQLLNSSNAEIGTLKKPHPPPLFVAHTLYLLPLLVLASALSLLASYLVPKIVKAYKRRRSTSPFHVDEDDDVEVDVVEPVQPPLPSQGLWSDLRAHFRSLRVYGSVIVALDILRTLCLFALVGLTIYAAIQAESPVDDKDSFLDAMKKKKKKKGKKNRSPVDYTSLELGELGACLFYIYNLVFSLLLLRLRHDKLRRRLTTHIDILLFLAFGIFAYRDIWPQFTYYLEMSDLDNAITWSRIALLGVAGVLIPLLRPRTYVPVDPLNPTPEDQLHPEQTAPLLFYVFYEFMTGLVWRAWKTPALPYDELHPLADYDRAQHLYDKHIETLDPVRRRKAGKKVRHLFFSILATFRTEFIVVSIMAFICAFMEMVPAISINHLLQYIETDGKGATIRPILWILALFVGPTAGSLAIQYYVFVMTRCLVRAEALLTQLLFDQALRIRMKDSLGEDEKTDTPAIQVEDTDAEAGDEDATKVKADAAGDKSSGQGVVGKINVLMAQDIETVIEGRDLALTFVYAPTQIIICMVYLYRILSWSALFGVGAIIISFPIPGMITKWATDIQNERMEKTDARVDVVTESVGALRIIKMFGWEDRIKARIAAKREEELKWTWKRRLMDLLNLFVNMFLPVLTMVASFAAYTLIQHKPLTASTVFTSMVIFENLKGVMGLIIYMVTQYITSGVSLQRLNKFLNESDMIDVYSQGTRATLHSPEQLEAEANGLIRLKNATFAWGEDTGNKNIINFRLNVPDVTFAKGKINLITGPTGSGKSSLLKALTGELHFEPRDDSSFFYLPRDGGVSFAAQESWCMSDSIKDNILFGSPYDEARYRQVLHDCALEPDLKLFDDGDLTEIGERGVTLSGGQKARITLARAIYANTAVVLLDDIFSALDTLTSRFILDNLFKGDLVKDRTVVLVTHHIHLAAPVAAYMVTMGENGTVVRAEPIDSRAISPESSTSDVAGLAKNEDVPTTPATTDKPADKAVTKLIKDEEKAEGRISRKALLSFFSHFGGGVYWTVFFGLVLAGQGLTAYQTLWLGHWSSAYAEAERPEDVSVVYWLGLYIVWVLAGLVALGASAVIYYLGSMRASRIIHAKLVDHIFGAYMRFLDSTPVGRIISRFTKDMKAIDLHFTELAYSVADMTVALIIRFLTAVIFVPIFSIPAIFIGILGGFLAEVYMHAQLSVKREMSNAKSPLFSHFASAITGIVSIRAYGAEEQMRQQARRKADKYTRAATAFYNLNRWVTIRIDMLGGLFSCLLAMFIVYGNGLDASTSGFALVQGIAFSTSILWWVRMVNDMEVQGNSVERVEDYLVIDQEPASVDSKKPPAAWPTSGEIILDRLSAKYVENGPLVLDEVSVRIKSGEKIGVVGRTGSGKSTLTLALLRMIPTTGNVYIDGMRTDKLNLHDLRSHVTIIPQDPILLSGTLRFNLDPFGDHDDAVLNDALEASGLSQVRRSENGGRATPQRLTLDTQIAAGGSNLSQGQRQLVALARALVRQSKVLILDEATASVDFDTDQIIQKSIRNLPESTTVLTVAHRLATIMDYDRILVLGAGKVLEFDTPEALRANPDGYFAKLVQAMEGPIASGSEASGSTAPPPYNES